MPRKAWARDIQTFEQNGVDQPTVQLMLEQLAAGGGGGGVTDHGALTGLADDDHTQYHNDARGDARYAGIGHDHDADYAAISHNHAASAITSGTIATARLGSGTADATTFLRGDQTYAVPPAGGLTHKQVLKRGLGA